MNVMSKIKEASQALVRQVRTIWQRLELLASRPGKAKSRGAILPSDDEHLASGGSLQPASLNGSRLAAPKPQKIKPIRRRSRQRVYRLKGYTTVAKINRKRQSEKQQRFLRRLLIAIVIILMIILMFNLYNPVRDLTEWYRIIGIKDLSELTQKTASSEETTEATGGTAKSSTQATKSTTAPKSTKTTTGPTTTKSD